MVLFATPIFASSADTLVVKLVIFVIVAIVWGIGALVKLATKQAEDARRAQAARQAALLEEIQVRQRPPVVAKQSRSAPTPARGRGPVLAPPPLPMALQLPPAGVRRPVAAPGSTPRKAAPPRRRALVAESAATQTATGVGVTLTEIGRGAFPPSPARRDAGAAAATSPITQLDARNLRQQIVLNEILQPPLALRERSI